MKRNHGKNKNEVGGEIIDKGNGKFGYTQRVGTKDALPVRPETKGYAGAWHTHGEYETGYVNLFFSTCKPDEMCDAKLYDRTGKPGWLVNALGKMMRYDPDPNKKQNGIVTDLGSVYDP